MVGLLLGAPTLDIAPYGLGHQRKEQTHYFQALRVHLPRAELGRRAAQREEIKGWQDGAYGPDGSSEVCHLVSEPAYLQSASPCAFFDADPFSLEPGEEAIVPATWSCRPTGDEEFLCYTPPVLDKGVAVVPGLCSVDDREMMLCVRNETLVPVELDRGDLLAVAYEIPEGAYMCRRGGGDGAPSVSVRGAETPLFREGDEALVTPFSNSAQWPRSDSVALMDESDGGASVSVGAAEGPGSVEKIFHLVQDEDLIARVHQEELPPDEYYDELRGILAAAHPNASPGLVEHVVALSAAFDTAAGFALSFGIKKFQLAQLKAKLVGEIVGRFGRSPNPDLCAAIRNWPPSTILRIFRPF